MGRKHVHADEAGCGRDAHVAMQLVGGSCQTGETAHVGAESQSGNGPKSGALLQLTRMRVLVSGELGGLVRLTCRQPTMWWRESSAMPSHQPAELAGLPTAGVWYVVGMNTSHAYSGRRART